MENENSVKLADFGLSKIDSSSNKPISCAGTTRWMAPEVMEDNEKPYSCKADIW